MIHAPVTRVASIAIVRACILSTWCGLSAAGRELIDVVRIRAHAVAGRQPLALDLLWTRRTRRRVTFRQFRRECFSTYTPTGSRELGGINIRHAGASARTAMTILMTRRIE
jgi:hypothetical protein